MVGDATTDQALLIRRWLRELGFQSEIYAQYCHPFLENTVRPLARYRRHKRERLVIYHHAIGSTTADWLLESARPLILIYHNVTPPEYFAATDPALAQLLTKGRRQLAALRPYAVLALAASGYNESDLLSLGYPETAILPIVLDESQYQMPLSAAITERYRKRRPLLLFVGRLAPNKRQDDLIQLLCNYRRLQPEAHLVLVGSNLHRVYARWLRHLSESFGLGGAVTITGHVSQQELVSYYKTADLFVSMSEHEGFGKPLIESMYLGVPVLAYASSAVPATLGQAGVLFHHKQFEALAEIAELLISNAGLRNQIIETQLERSMVFTASRVKQRWNMYLENLGVLGQPS